MLGSARKDAWGTAREGGGAALEAVRVPTDALLAAFLHERCAALSALDERLEPVADALSRLVLAGGKRLRPAFVWWGHRAAGGDGDAILGVGAAVELLHTFALVHDDVMDRSATRRGLPAVHRALAGAHRDAGLDGDADWFGTGGAILAGDLAFVWADELLDGCGLPSVALDRVRPVFTELRTEVTCGQYLDLWLAGAPDGPGSAVLEADALKVALLKSARYTVTRPLEMGAAAADGSPELRATLRRFGDAAGVAFQLRDDILGLYGDPAATGKGALDDLREGKRTMLMVVALERADAAGRATLRGLLGRGDLEEADAARAREIVTACGALAEVERLLAERREAAARALDQIEGPARNALAELAALAAYREL